MLTPIRVLPQCIHLPLPLRLPHTQMRRETPGVCIALPKFPLQTGLQLSQPSSPRIARDRRMPHRRRTPRTVRENSRFG